MLIFSVFTYEKTAKKIPIGHSVDLVLVSFISLIAFKFIGGLLVRLGKTEKHQLLKQAFLRKLAISCLANVVDGASTAKKVAKSGTIDGFFVWEFSRMGLGGSFVFAVVGFTDGISLGVFIAAFVWEVVVFGKAIWPSLVEKVVRKLEGRVDVLEEHEE